MSIEISNASGGKVALDEAVFGVDYKESLIHQVVTAYLAGARAGTKRQKTRAEVAGGSAKPWAQKKTGRARAGTSRGPIWRTGGRAFAARPQNWDQKINRKSYRIAMRSIFSELVRQDRLIVVDKFEIDAPKTKSFLQLAEKVGFDRGLVVCEDDDMNVWLSARNIPRVWLSDVASVDPVSLVGSDKVLISANALKSIEERLK
ncbi:50S ribosomal protein L4 [Gammaproteobacteria bacterium]|nr:50S ribosomal protein L4 [Gammaproteobacteria bacterium]